MNQVNILGNLTRDPQLRYLPSNMAVVDFGIAQNHRYRTAAGEDREEPCFVECVAFGKTGELINQNFVKGKPILIVNARLKYEAWEDKVTSQKRSTLKLVIDRFDFLPRNEGRDITREGDQRPESEERRARASRRTGRPPGINARKPRRGHLARNRSSKRTTSRSKA